MSLNSRIRKTLKSLWLSVRPRPETQRIVFILGCQRSGTTMLLRIFERDWNAQTYHEQSILSRETTSLRLLPVAQLKEIFARRRAPLIVLKPLVESQHATALLKALPQGRAVWMFRHYRSVAASNLKKFGKRNGINDLRPLAAGEVENWRADSVPAEVRATVQAHFSENMSPWDAAVLFWYVRNALFFTQSLERHPRVRLCHYEAVLDAPLASLRDLYAWLERPFPGEHLARLVHTATKREIPDFPLSSDVERLAEGLWQRLLAVYAAQEKR